MLSNLNIEQQNAAAQIEGPVMVFAGAGTGKTRTLTHRVAYMINKKGISPYNILAITFTNKATNEMKERLEVLVGKDSLAVTISTFHSLAARILRRDIPYLGYDRNFSIIDVDEQLQEINAVIKLKNFDKKEYPGKKIQKMISYHKCFHTLPKDLNELKIYHAYNEQLKEKNLLDFDDLLIKLHELFHGFPEVLAKYQDFYQYILVDEFQDTNFIQYDIVRMLAFHSHNLFVVGDDDQSIYSFRGTNYENMKLFKKDFPEHKLFFLTKNYRSTQIILNGCNNLIAHNLDREKKALTSDTLGEEKDVRIERLYNEKIEVDYILEQIFSLRIRNTPLKEIAILYRSSVMSRNIELGLIQMGIAYQIYGGISYLRRKEIKDIIAYFKLILKNDDVHSFERIVNVPGRFIGDATVDKILEIREKYQITLFEAIDACKTILTKKKYEDLLSFKNLIIKYSQRLEEISLVEFYDELLDAIDYREYLKAEKDFEERLENVEEFKSILLQIEEENKGNLESVSKRDLLLEAFDEAILSDDKLSSQRQNQEGIVLSTIHSVKGLEFDYVFVIGLEENNFPNLYRADDKENLEEERRVAYVAMTRARKRLYLLSVDHRLLYGERFKNDISRFILEFQGVKKEDKKTFKFEEDGFAEERLSIKSLKEYKDDSKPTYHVGDKVTHGVFGQGVIIAIYDNVGHIFFDKNHGLKKILLDHSSLKKL